MHEPPRALLMDMDGVLYHGAQVLPHAREFVTAMAPLPMLFLTNNPVATPDQVVSRLQTMGFGAIARQQVLTSAEATAVYLQRRRPGFRYFAVGADGLDQALRQHGTGDDRDADFVVVGEGPGLDFDTLTTGINLVLQRGAVLVSTNPDATVDAYIDGRRRVLPGGGALVAAFETACGCKALTVGKPESLLFEMALERLRLAPMDCVMIGDRPDTDIFGAQRLDMPAALVRTGRFAVGASLPKEVRPPQWDVDDLGQLLAIWRRRWPDWPKKEKAG